MSEREGPVEDDITLGQLLDRAAQAYEQVQAAPAPNDAAVQSKIAAALSELTLCASLITRLAVLSPNETLEDITTSDLKCISVDGLRGMLLTLKKTKGGNERKLCLESAKTHLLDFTRRVESYEIVPADERSRYKGPLSTVQNPALRREGKIAQFRLEKELKSRLEEFRKRSEDRKRPTIFATADHSRSSRQKAEIDEDGEEDGARETYITWLRFLYLKAHQELSSIELELDLLGTGAQMQELPHPGRTNDEEDLTWRLDRLSTRSGPLIGPSGKVLRPFTILPAKSSTSAATDRIRLREEVFRPDWNLPTMTIDEYLDEQQAMGNFLSGGGRAQAETETEGERTKREAEDDNAAGEEAAEGLRRKAIEWDEFTDTHRKGEGNMMNRG
ncbi:hypothetical protein CROQUDRAFT_67356 [Cronartium quercuum f. sp. fusiforme G11]|uniref:TAP42-like protein n=1 Tax=Cronartium quercuum f. sp. fusiforme G11 TaxID=708437 RepID=A0A9P6T7S4_9BASI|nr:hypothetical protein CROQUDRAFT_67356 [Cronartium quercuum f. sp. fusiforme G11]